MHSLCAVICLSKKLVTMGDAAADAESDIGNVFALTSLSIFSFEDCKVKPLFNKPLHPPYNM